MKDTRVTDLDDDEDIRRQVRQSVLGSTPLGPGPDLAVVRTRGLRRRRRRQAAQVGALTAAAAAVTAVVTVGVLPGRDDQLVAAPTTANELVDGLGQAAPQAGPEAVPAIVFDGEGPADASPQPGTGRYLGSDGTARYWVTTSATGGVCAIRDRDGQSTATSCSTVEDFLDQGLQGGEVVDDQLYAYAVVPDAFDTTALKADGYSEAPPNVLTRTSPEPASPVVTPR